MTPLVSGPELSRNAGGHGVACEETGVAVGLRWLSMHVRGRSRSVCREMVKWDMGRG